MENQQRTNLTANQMYKMYRETGGMKDFKNWLEQAKSENTINSFGYADGGGSNESITIVSMPKEGIPIRNILIGGLLLIGIGYLTYTYLWKNGAASKAANID